MSLAPQVSALAARIGAEFKTRAAQAITGAERAKLAGVAAGATANATNAQLRDRATHTGTQTAATISDMLEVVQDAIGTYVAPGANMTSVYNDETGVTTLSVVAAGEMTNTDPEVVRDVIGGALVGGGNVAVTVNDAGDTITIALTGRLPDAHLPTRLAETALDGRYRVVGGSLSWSEIIGKPSQYTPLSHVHGTGDISGLSPAATASFGSTAGTVTEGDDPRLTNNAKAVQGGAEKVAVPTATSGIVTLNCAVGSIFLIAPVGNITLAVTNIPASETSCTIRVRVAQGSTPRAITMPSGTAHWFTDQPTQTANKVTTYTLETVDAGANWDIYAGVEK